jgi:XTP/dITP diphosphohydrolase
MRLLIATRNQGKKREYEALFHDPRLELLTLTDMGIETRIEETGETYAENALLKAHGYAAMSGVLTLADDSGLEVDALGGAPGVYSARYAGEGASDETRYRSLLRSLEGVPDERRSARFRCVIALAWHAGHAEVVEGVCEGVITHEPKGEHGFGYDPVFFVIEKGQTMAQLSENMKNQISHRARAAAQARIILERELVGRLV